MICISPLYVDPKKHRLGRMEVGCGQCLNCRLNYQREWTVRMLLEQATTPSQLSCFLTLTYADSELPERGSLKKVHAQGFLKRLRKNRGKVRFYLSGEYGDKTFRPHYHAAIFGLEFGYGMVDLPEWPHGHCFAGILTMQSARYVAGYLTKRMTKAEDPRLERTDPDTGEVYRLEPEFSTMSLRPGVGGLALEELGRFLRTSIGERFVSDTGDVQKEVRFDGKKYPVSRYLKGKLREDGRSLSSLRERLTPEGLLQLSVLRDLEASRTPEQREIAAKRREVSRLRGQWLSRKLKGRL